MARNEKSTPKLFVDADVLFAEAAFPSEHSASLMILTLSEITLIKALTSEQVVTEAERNLESKIPKALPAFQHLVSRCLTVVPDPEHENVLSHDGLADPKDLPILVAAVDEGCPWLVTFNIRDYQPGHPDVNVLRPGEFISRIREQLTHLR
ncbi:MAG: PIN domain-containing protein [Anaerolineales bacterium]